MRRLWLGPVLSVLLVATQCAYGANITLLPTSLKSPLNADSIVCTHPESLFLIYEGSSIAMAGGGKDAFKAYFAAAGSVFESRSECLVQSQTIDVTVDAYATLENPLKADAVIYGRFGITGSVSKVWATIGNLPEFEAWALGAGVAKQPTTHEGQAK